MSYYNSYEEYIKGLKTKPKTPQLQQLNTNINDENINVDNNDGNMTSPQTLNTPNFDNIQIFPTPMTYLPTSPMQGLGILGVSSQNINNNNNNNNTSEKKLEPFVQSEIHIKKRRDKSIPLRNFNLNVINDNNNHSNNTLINQHKDSRNLDELLKSEHRIVSELVPAPSVSPQRISSLPTVNEDLGSSGSTTVIGESEFVANKQQSNEYVQESLKSVTDTNIDLLNAYLVPTFQTKLKLNRIKQIGKGNFSVVDLYQNVDKQSNNLKSISLVAVKKIIYPDHLFGSHISLNHQDNRYHDLLSSFESSLTRELSVLQILNHPCIIHLYGINDPIFLTNKTPLTSLIKENVNSQNNNNNKLIIPPCDIIMSYCQGGDLLNSLTQCNGGLELKLIQRMFTELSLAVKYLHDNLIIHRDLKLENILLTYSLDEIKIMLNDESQLSKFNGSNIIQLTDFGLCKQITNIEEKCTARCGSEDYVSPEILMGIPYDGRLSDSWALGVILYSLLEDRLPFDPPPNANVRQRRRATSHRIASFEWAWYKLKNNDTNGKIIVNNTLIRKDKRWDIDNIIESPFVSEMIKELTFI